MRIWLRSVAIFAVLSIVHAQPNALNVRDLPTLDRADWLYKARWGVLIHFLGQAGMGSDEWNRRVDQFDAEGLAGQLQSVGVGYLMFTIGQNSGYFAAPNQTYDSFTQIQPTKCSRRDLILDLSQALSKRGIRLLVYFPSAPPDLERSAIEKLGWQSGPHRNSRFQQQWEAVIREWSLRWGRNVAGWWFDGCFWPNAMYRQTTTPNFASFAAAARQGNPASIVAFNPGIIVPIISITGEEDYTAGEMNNPFLIECTGRWVDGVQWHVLSYLGEWWGRGTPRFPGPHISSWTATQIAKGGVVTWDAPIDARGHIRPEFLEQLTATGKAARASR